VLVAGGDIASLLLRTITLACAGVLYFHGQGVAANLSEAFRYFEMASTLDHDGAYNLGTMYQVGPRGCGWARQAGASAQHGSRNNHGWLPNYQVCHMHSAPPVRSCTCYRVVVPSAPCAPTRPPSRALTALTAT
jgi:TPR repeat protein